MKDKTIIRLYWVNELRRLLENYNREIALQKFLDFAEAEEKAINERWDKKEAEK